MAVSRTDGRRGLSGETSGHNGRCAVSAPTVDSTRPRRPSATLGARRRRVSSCCSAASAVSGWVAYQYFGTNVVSQHAFEQETSGLRTKWESEPAHLRRPASRSCRTSRPPRCPAMRSRLLRIPTSAPRTRCRSWRAPICRCWPRVSGHYPTSASRVRSATSRIAGHRVTHGQPFSRLLELDKGDQIIVETRPAIYTYVLDDSPERPDRQGHRTWVLDPVPGKPDAKPTQAADHTDHLPGPVPLPGPLDRLRPPGEHQEQVGAAPRGDRIRLTDREPDA